MEHQRCYIYTPSEPVERPSKRQRTSQHEHQPQLAERLAIFHEQWSQQEQRIQATLEDADGVTQEKITSFVTASAPTADLAQVAIPTGLVVAGPSIASHGPFFVRLGQKIQDETKSGYAVMTSGESPNLKTFLKNLIKKLTSRIGDDDDDELIQTASSRKGPKLLDFDLGHVQEWRKKNPVQSIVVAIQDSEAFDTGILTELVELFHSWLDRLPFILLFGIATSAESFEDRLSGKSLRYLNGQKYDVTQSDEIIEKLFSATVAHKDVCPWIGPTLCRRILDRQKDHVQSVQDYVDGLKYAYMSHFYASSPTVLLNDNLTFAELSSDIFEAVRNLPSFRRLVEVMLDEGKTGDVRKLLDSDSHLYEETLQHIELGKYALSSLSKATEFLLRIRESLQMSSRVRLSTLWTRAAAGELLGSPLLRETMLSIKRTPSDRLVPLLDSLEDFNGSPELKSIQLTLKQLIKNSSSSTPLRSQDDVRNDSLRTTVVAQKVLLSKHTAALSEQDKAYSKLVTSLYDYIDNYFNSALVDPRTLFLSEILMYDLKSPHTEVFQPKPRFAIERALASPHDYLGCECCSGKQGGDAALSITQPSTAILYQMYLESGTIINASDLWLAFNAIVGEGDDEDEPKTMALFQRALAELKYLGLVKPSRKKTDHIAKMMWKGL